MRYLYPLLLLLLLFFLPDAARAQKGDAAVNGTIRDKTTGQPVAYASTAILAIKDSSSVTGNVSNEKGQFELLHIPYGHYRLVIQALGYAKWSRAITLDKTKNHIRLDTVLLEKLSVALNEAIVKGELVPIRFKGDTVEYSAAAYKLHPNAMVEDLLKKLPGVQVDKDGNVTAMGQKVDKVTVDSKSFFGNNPKLATQNLPANIVDKVQVSEDKEAAEQNPNQDKSQQPKAINIVLKPGKKNGVFGSARLGYGTDQRYDGNIAGFYFTDKYQLSIIGTANNLNKAGFDMNDYQTMRSAGSTSTLGPGNGNFVSIGVNNGSVNVNGLFSNATGISTSTGGGLNYSRDLTKNLNISANYFYGGNNAVNDQKTFRQNILPDTAFYQAGNSTSRSNRFNHQAGIDLKYKLDSVTNLTFRTGFGFTQSNSSSGNDYSSLAEDSSLVNDGTQSYTDNDKSNNFTAGLNFNHSFRQKGRRVYAYFNFSRTDDHDNGYNISNNHYYKQVSGGVPDSTDQYFTYHNTNTSIYGSLYYTQPFDTLNSLSLNYYLRGGSYDNNKQAFDFSQGSGKYDIPNGQLTNYYRSTTLQHTIGINYTHQFKKFSVSPGISLLPSTLSGENVLRDSSFQRIYFDVAPTLAISLKLPNNKHLSFNMRTNVSLPDITQLQPVIDNSNPLYLTKGNPDLKPAVANSFNLDYNSFDIAHNFATFFFAGINFTRDQIATSSYFDKTTGVQTSQPVNVNGAYNAFVNFNLGIPIKKIKGLTFRPNVWSNYSNNIVPVNGVNNINRNLSLNGGLNIDYSGKDWLDLSVSANEGYTNSKYSLTPQTNANYLNQRYGVNFSLYLPLSFIFNSDISYLVNSGLSQGYNKNYVLWNGYVSKDFLKSKLLTVKLSVYDLLGENVQLQRTVQSNYIQDTQNTTLTQYFMLTLQYRLQMFNGKAKPFQRKKPSHRMMFFF